MRNPKWLPSTSLPVLLLVCLLSAMTACEKVVEYEKTPSNGRFRFTNQGKQYVLPYQNRTEWGIDGAGIFISRPDLFNGAIHFPSPGCAYLIPQNNARQLALTANCRLADISSRLVDSLYFYQSGSAKLNYTNCLQTTEVDIVTGISTTYDLCDTNGTFDLVLQNKENKTIAISEGTLEMYRVRK